MYIKSLIGFCCKHTSIKNFNKSYQQIIETKYFSTTYGSQCNNKENKTPVKKETTNPKNERQDYLDFYPKEIKYRKKYTSTRPVERTLGIMKDDLIEAFGQIKNHRYIRPKDSQNYNFDHFKQQIFPEHCDIVIIGGGLVGVACAYHLQEDCEEEEMRIVVVENDLTYSRASSKLSMGGSRQQFSLPENIMLSRYGMDFLQNSAITLALKGCKAPKLDLNLHGFLCLANEKQMPELLENDRIHREYGCYSRIITKNEIQARYPWINVNDIEAGIIGTQYEGWFDPYKLLVALARKTHEQGTHFVQGKVTGVDCDEICTELIEGQTDYHNSMKRARAVNIELPNGETRKINAGFYVIAAGSWSKEVGLHFGIGSTPNSMMAHPIPVEPRKRYGFCFKSTGGPGLNCPFLVDTDGSHFRREGLDDSYVCGLSPSPDNEPLVDNLNVDDSYFEEFIKPSIIKRCPSFKNLELSNSWAGYYDYNTFDQNPLMGKHPQYYNLFYSTGFSGHGAQHALGAGKAMTELMYERKYKTLNMERFGIERVMYNDPIHERCIY